MLLDGLTLFQNDSKQPIITQLTREVEKVKGKPNIACRKVLDLEVERFEPSVEPSIHCYPRANTAVLCRSRSSRCRTVFSEGHRR